MVINLTRSGCLHGFLPKSLASDYVSKASHALSRHHEPDVAIKIESNGVQLDGTLQWEKPQPSDAKYYDFNRVTEDGAEALALSLVHTKDRWEPLRRMQSMSGESADWLIQDEKKNYIALEISGIDQGSVRQRLSQKKQQVSRAVGVRRRAACVVEFKTPQAVIQ